MEMQKEILIDKKYIIKGEKEKGKGLTSKVFKVEEKETKKIYAAKILLTQCILYDNEREILKFLQNKNIPNIINLIDSGYGDISIGQAVKKKQYIILEYAEKGDLSKYINLSGKPLKEIHSKLFFSKIVKAVQAMHKNGICHRDLKTSNILLDNKFNPKICDFGFSTYIKNNLKDVLGTPMYAAPEIYKANYDGEKVDIFALGVILFNLITGLYGFNEANINDKSYRLIMLKKFSNFWKDSSQNIGVSEEFKNLYVKMVSYKPIERPTIEQILNDKWMEELKNKNEKEIKDIELEIYEDFIERENNIKDSTEIKVDIVNNNKNNRNIGNRSSSNEEKNYFDYNLIPKDFKKGKYLEYYIKITGNINPVEIMNSLIKKLMDENEKLNEYQCHIDINKNKLKFKAYFEEAEKDEEEEIDENLEEEINKLNLDKEKIGEENNFNEDNKDNDGIIKKCCCIKFELFKSNEEEYLLRFVRESGEKDDFYKILKTIKCFITNI